MSSAYVWNTGDKVQSIEISTPGTYTVTVTDACNETAKATISVGEFPKKITNATIGEILTANCMTGEIKGTLEAFDNSTGLGKNKYLWSDDQTSKEISITQKGKQTYAVTVTDICGTTASTSKDIEPEGLFLKTVSIMKDSINKCELSLNAITNVSSDNFKYQWSTSEDSAKIIIDKIGTYTVTVTDICGTTATNSIQILLEDFSRKDLDYANVFYPDGLGIQLSQVKTAADSEFIDSPSV